MAKGWLVTMQNADFLVTMVKGWLFGYNDKRLTFWLQWQNADFLVTMVKGWLLGCNGKRLTFWLQWQKADFLVTMAKGWLFGDNGKRLTFWLQRQKADFLVAMAKGPTGKLRKAMFSRHCSLNSLGTAINGTPPFQQQGLMNIWRFIFQLEIVLLTKVVAYCETNLRWAHTLISYNEMNCREKNALIWVFTVLHGLSAIFNMY